MSVLLFLEMFSTFLGYAHLFSDTTFGYTSPPLAGEVAIGVGVLDKEFDTTVDASEKVGVEDCGEEGTEKKHRGKLLKGPVLLSEGVDCDLVRTVVRHVIGGLAIRSNVKN